MFTINFALAKPKVKFILHSCSNWRIHGSNSSFEVEKRINLAVATKEHFLENIDPHIFLKHRTYDVDKEKYLFGLIDMIALKGSFQIPVLFHDEDTVSETIRLFPIFDDAIRRLADKAIDRSPEQESKINLILEREYA